MPDIKKISVNIILLFSVVVIEIFLFKYSVPVAVFDIILAPLMVVFLFYLIKICFSENNKSCISSEVPRTSLPVCISYLFFSLFLTGLGGWCIYTGIINPLGFFTGVKGAVHGYTLLLLGLVVIFISILIFFVQLKYLAAFIRKE